MKRGNLSANVAQYGDKGPFKQLRTASSSLTRSGSKLLGTRVEYGYDAYGNVTMERNFGASDWTANLAGYDDTIVTRIFHRNLGKYIVSKVRRERVEAGLVPTADYWDTSKALRTVSKNYTAEGNLTWTDFLSGDPSRPWVRSEVFEYDDWGNVIRQRDGRGQWSTYAYDPHKHLFLIRETNAVGHVSQTEWHHDCRAYKSGDEQAIEEALSRIVLVRRMKTNGTLDWHAPDAEA